MTRGHVERLFTLMGAGQTAITFEDRSLTFGELDRPRRYARGLAAAGVNAATAWPSSETSPEVSSLSSAYRLGAIHVPINARYRAGQWRISSRIRARRCFSGESPCAGIVAACSRLERARFRIWFGAETREAGNLAFERLVETSLSGRKRCSPPTRTRRSLHTPGDRPEQGRRAVVPRSSRTLSR